MELCHCIAIGSLQALFISKVTFLYIYVANQIFCVLDVLAKTFAVLFDKKITACVYC